MLDELSSWKVGMCQLALMSLHCFSLNVLRPVVLVFTSYVDLKQGLPEGTVAMRRPSTDKLSDDHSSIDGHSGSDGMKRQPPAIGGVGLTTGSGAAMAFMAVRAVRTMSAACSKIEEAILHTPGSQSRASGDV